VSTPRRAQLDIGEDVAGYRVESFIARGGMAVVYRARDLALSRPVALKLIAPELASNETFRARFVRESELAASIDHPNVIPVYGAGEADGLLYIAMRFVQGEDLGVLLRRRGRLPVAEAMPMFTAVAGALDAAHARGLVHRDIKPGNILVADAEGPAEDRHVYLTDFGLTKRSSSLTGFTTTGHFLGTIAYVAPEQIENRGVDKRTDVYSLACVFFEVLAGSPPFQHDDDAALLWAHMAQAPPPLSQRASGLPTEVDGVLQRAMAKDPEQRPGSCRQLVAELRAAFRGAGAAQAGREAPSLPPTRAAGIGAAPTAAPPPARPPATHPPAPRPAAAHPGAAHPFDDGPTDSWPPGSWPPGPAPVPAPAADSHPGVQPVPAAPAPRRPRGRILAGALAVLLVVAVGAWLLIAPPWATWTAYDGSQQAAPFALEHPSEWLEHPDRQGVMFAEQHLVGIFTTGDPRKWDQATQTAGRPDMIEGLLLRRTNEQVSLAGPAEAHDTVVATPAFRNARTADPVRATVHGAQAWRIDGELTDPRSPAGLKIAFQYYLVPIPGGTAHAIFFALPDQLAGQQATFERVRDSIALPTA
jgi:serine/threonine protein kinase